jgi:Zn-dependent peptidase ImmA (M78 family)
MTKSSLISSFICRLGQRSLSDACSIAIKEVFGQIEGDRLQHAKNKLTSMGVKFELQAASLSKSGAEGQITYSPSGTVTIRTSRLGNLERQRFTLAHEIGHFVVREMLFPEGWNRDESRYRMAGLHSHGGTLDEELLANAIAAELILPSDAVVACTVNAVPSDIAEIVRELSAQYAASRLVTLRRVCDLAKWEALLLTLIRRREMDVESEARIDQSQLFLIGEATRYVRNSSRFIDSVAFEALSPACRPILHVRAAQTTWQAPFVISCGVGLVSTKYALAARSPTHP